MSLDEKVGDYFRQQDLEGKEVGIEIEMESDSDFPPSESTHYYWRKEHDGSLRGDFNMEYVLKNPMKRKFAFRALDRLAACLEECDTRVVDSVRAGTHVHINVRDLIFRELWSMVTCWYVLEELLTYTMCGEGRNGNHFCLRAQDADDVLFKVSGAVRTGQFHELKRDNVRYSALNFVSLFKYGSLEFRAMRTPLDFEEIKKWVTILLALKENSKLFPHPRHVIENFSHGGERNFLRQILGNEMAESIIARDPEGWERKLKRGIRNAQEIAYARDSWEEENECSTEGVYCTGKGKDYAKFLQFAEQFGIKIEDQENE